MPIAARPFAPAATLAAALLLAAASLPATAALQTYNFSASGARFTLSGSFSFDDLSAGATVDASELSSFSYTVAYRMTNESLGSFTLDPDARPKGFLFNFDAEHGVLTSGGQGTSTAQSWNHVPMSGGCMSGTPSYASHGAASQICAPGAGQDLVLHPVGASFFTATNVTPVLPVVPPPPVLPILPVLPLPPVLPIIPITPVFPVSPIPPTTPMPPITAPVPEPGTYALMLAGLGALGVAARRRKALASAPASA